jgi:3-hydroxybutyryl-CoA dehydrogenase
MTQFEFRNAVVIGTGMMGPGIAATLALGGLDTRILSRAQETARKGLRAARECILSLEEHGLTGASRSNLALERLSETTAFDDAIRSADVVIESAPEDMAFKRDLFARMDSIAPAECVLASNTSGLSITAIASNCVLPERILTTHFWNPPHLMPLVEVVNGERTAEHAALRVCGLLRHCGKVPVIVKKDRPGQLGNRLQAALQREAMNIVAEGIASVEDVDLAAKCGFGLRLPVYGIFEHMDAVGLDLAGAVIDYVTRDLASQPGMPEILRAKIRKGELGAASGLGFYDWRARKIEDVKERRDRFILDFLKRYTPGG